MTQKQVKAYELTAARAAMEKAGPYLDSIGKTDIALLDSDEYDEFLSLFVTEYQESIREQFKDTVPF